MVRTAFAKRSLLEYLESIGDPKTCTIGLILGQSLERKDYIIHLTKTVPGFTQKTAIEVYNNVSEISECSVAEHAKHATRMLPGAVYVLGIFLITEENILSPLSFKIKGILSHVQKSLGKNELLFGNNTANVDKLVLKYTKSSNTYSGLSYNVMTGSTVHVDFKFDDKDLNWLHLECNYEINESVLITNRNLSIKEQLKNIVQKVDSCLSNAIFLFNGELINNDETLASLTKSKSKFNINQPIPPIVTILQPLNCASSTFTSNTIHSKGFLKICGLISSNVWLQHRLTFKKAAAAIHEDIIRSLTARLAMHFDSLTEGEGNFNDSSSIHEPPRRVLIPVPGSEIMLTDYLFPGEGTQETMVSLKDVLDITVSNKNEIKEIEGAADLSEYMNELSEGEGSEMLSIKEDTNKMMYIVGGVVAFVVLVISLLIHFFKN